MTRRTRAQYDWDTQRFDEQILRKHITAPRRQKVQFIVVHHMTIVGTGTGSANDACYRTWQTRKASAHYGVDGDHVMQFVWDQNAAWSTASTRGNHGGISIEHANSTVKGWKVSGATWKNGAKLAAHLHVTHKLGRPVSGKTLMRHKDFFATECPGPFINSIWPQYVAEAQRVYDQITKTTPKPVETTKRWYTHRHLNMWGDDGAEGTRTFMKRLPQMVHDLTDGRPESITVNEVRAGAQAIALAKAMKVKGYDAALLEHGNGVFLLAGTPVQYKDSYTLPKKIQGAGRAEVAGRVRAKVAGHWVHIVTSHLDYRDGYDTLRVKQAKSVIAAARRFAIRYALLTWKSRTVIALDENSVGWTRDKAFLPAGFKVAVKHAIDGIYVNRQVSDKTVRVTASDHPILSATLRKKA